MCFIETLNLVKEKSREKFQLGPITWDRWCFVWFKVQSVAGNISTEDHNDDNKDM